MSVELSDDEIETVKNLIRDWGFEYGLDTDRDELIKLAEKIKMPKSYIDEHLRL